MFVLILSANISKYFGSGPFFPSNGFESKDNCQNYWWTNLLYVNNFVDTEKMVMIITLSQFLNDYFKISIKSVLRSVGSWQMICNFIGLLHLL